MGGRSGKFIVPRVEEKTEDSPREADTFEQVKAPDNEQSVQLLNGVVTAGPDVPCIDEVLEPSDDAKLENGLKENFTDENCEQANGSVAATDVLQNDSAKPPKKGNPISRILRRISRKGSNLKKHSTDRSSEIPEDTNDESIQEQTTEAHPECTADRSLDSTDNPVLIAADNLVHDVILSATQTHLEETRVSRIEPCEEIHNHVETSHTQELLTEVETLHVSPCANESYVNGEAVTECTVKSEDVMVNDVPTYEVVNGVNFDNTNDHIDDAVIQSKLANLELVNGHSEVNGFHNETGNSVKLADDY
ncbi:hypothetical protein EWB00_001303 [Schistosoma japonicum]|uniref:Uncharacterized protein n=1 Tax=Schistosoma japonicum TaxID=6182 RepID=A0A4Z2DG23_SCHJA|nr:hypothetical protein EWB00_001303 [Schistosoma japonicum]